MTSPGIIRSEFVLKQKINSVIAALSVPEHCLSFNFVCDGDDQIHISCVV